MEGESEGNWRVNGGKWRVILNERKRSIICLEGREMRSVHDGSTWGIILCHGKKMMLLG